MAIKLKENERDSGIEIDLTGPDGDAYCLLRTAESFCKQFGWDSDPIIDEYLKENPGWEPVDWNQHFGYEDEIALKLKRIKKQQG
jgi:hypothetical protein